MYVSRCDIKAKLHLSGLTGAASHPDMQKSRIIGFSFTIGYIAVLKWGKKFLHTAVLGYIFIYLQTKH
jgi:hypothetical protein